jgi:excisionase family DNA binding protein
MPDTPSPRGYMPNELAVLLRCSADRIRSMIRRGEINALDIGRHGGRRRYPG